MAELALGALGACVAGFQVVKGLQQALDMIEDIKHAGKEMDEFFRETETFIGILDYFRIIVTDTLPLLEPSRRDKRETLVNSIIGCFEGVEKDAKEVTRKIYVSPNSKEPTIWKVAVRWNWFWWQNAIIHLRHKIERVKSNTNLLITTVIFESLTRRIKELEEKNEQIPPELKEHLKYYKQRIRKERVKVRISVQKMTTLNYIGINHSNLSMDDEANLRALENSINEESVAIVPRRRRRSKNTRRYPDNRGSGRREDEAEIPRMSSHQEHRSFRDEIGPTPRLSRQSSQHLSLPSPRRSPQQIYRSPSLRPSPLLSQSSLHHSSSQNFNPKSDQSSQKASHQVRQPTPQLGQQQHRQKSQSPRRGSSVDLASVPSPPHVSILPAAESCVTNKTSGYFGKRVRDDGKSICVESSKWPKEVVDSADPATLLELGDQFNSEIDSRAQPVSDIINESREKPPKGGHFQQNSSSKTQHRSGTNPTAKDNNLQPGVNESRWRPLPPFDKSDLEERKKRGNSTPKW